MEELLNKIIKEINSRAEDTQSVLGSNSCRNMQEYGYSCGLIEGYRISKELVEEVLNDYKKKVEEDYGSSFE